MAANVSLPNTLTNGQPNDAAQVMADLNALVTWINTNAVHLDGAKQMGGTLSGPAGVDPVSADQYSRKAYVDAQVAAEAATRASAITTEATTRATADSDPARRGASASRVANQAITSGVQTAISFDTELWDSGTFFTLGSPDRITFQTSGEYIVTWNVDATLLSTFGSDLYINGVRYVTGGTGFNTAGGGTFFGLSGSMIVSVNAGWTMQVYVLQTSGSNKNYTANLACQRLAA